MKRFLAIDWGTKRLGVAVTDPLNITAQPLMVLTRDNKKKTWQTLSDLIEQYQVGTVVVGIPLRTDGKESQKVQLVREWIDEAREHLGSVDFVECDERFTTVEAQRILREGEVKLKAQRGLTDKIAASLLLEQFLKMNRQTTQ